MKKLIILILTILFITSCNRYEKGLTTATNSSTTSLNANSISTLPNTSLITNLGINRELE